MLLIFIHQDASVEIVNLLYAHSADCNKDPSYIEGLLRLLNSLANEKTAELVSDYNYYLYHCENEFVPPYLAYLTSESETDSDSDWDAH